MKILVVEDDVQLGQQILSALEQTGWVPELAQDGIDAYTAPPRKSGTSSYSISAYRNWMV